MPVQYLIMCRSLTYAQRASAALEHSGVTAPIARAPREISAEGCGYCVKVSPKKLRDALRVLSEAKIPYGRVFRQSDGGYAEVTA